MTEINTTNVVYAELSEIDRVSRHAEYVVIDEAGFGSGAKVDAATAPPNPSAV